MPETLRAMVRSMNSKTSIEKLAAVYHADFAHFVLVVEWLITLQSCTIRCSLCVTTGHARAMH